MEVAKTGTSRANFLKMAGVAGLGLAGVKGLRSPSLHPSTPSDATAVLRTMLMGNRRFVAGALRHPNQSPARRRQVAAHQHPFAIVLSCSDSRVPAEVVFDRGIGDIFVVRAAGNVADDVAIGSVEYAVDHFHPPLLMVLGHQRCGAVEATIKGGRQPGHIGSITRLIDPAVAIARHHHGDLEANSVRINAQLTARRLLNKSHIIRDAANKHGLRVVSAVYSLDVGSVRLV